MYEPAANVQDENANQDSPILPKVHFIFSEDRVCFIDGDDNFSFENRGVKEIRKIKANNIHSQLFLNVEITIIIMQIILIATGS